LTAFCFWGGKKKKRWSKEKKKRVNNAFPKERYSIILAANTETLCPTGVRGRCEWKKEVGGRWDAGHFRREKRDSKKAFEEKKEGRKGQIERSKDMFPLSLEKIGLPTNRKKITIKKK